MSKTRVESKVIPYQCALVGRGVHIHRDYKILVDRSGEEMARAVASTSCSDMDNCPIATHRGNATSYDWSKCAFRKAEGTA